MLVDPADDDDETNPIEFLGNATDEEEAINATLWTDESGSWAAKETRWNGEVDHNYGNVTALFHLNKETAFGEDADTVFDFTLSRKFGFLFMLAGIRQRIGFDYKKRGVFLNEKITQDYPDAKIIVVTAFVDHDFDKAKASAIFTKPYDFEPFLETIKKVAKGKIASPEIK